MNPRIISSLLLVALLITGVFGVVLMSVGSTDGMTCALPSMGNMDCAAFANALAMVGHHVGTYQGLLTAILAVVVGVFVYMATRTIVKSSVALSPPRFYVPREEHDGRIIHDTLLHRWLSCLRNMDAAAVSRVHVMSS